MQLGLHNAGAYKTHEDGSDAIKLVYIMLETSKSWCRKNMKHVITL